MSKLVYPTLDLFIYDLREGLGESTEEINKNQEYFASRFSEQYHHSLKQRDAIEGEYVKLLGNKGRENFTCSTNQYTLKGWQYPVRLGDSYGSILDCSVEHYFGLPQQAKQDSVPVSCFSDLKTELEKRLAGHPSTIGQVWMLSGQLSNFTLENAEAIAKECSKINSFNLNWDLDLRGKSKFMGGILFEFWHYRLHIPSDISNITNIHEIQDNNCVLIAIYPDTETAKKASTFNFDWLRLFAYRSKILWAYGQSQYLKKKLRSNFVEIEKYQKDFKSAKSGKLNLNKLRQILVDAQNTLWLYTNNLNNIFILKRTIEVNLLNYERRLETIKKKLNPEQENNDLYLLQQQIGKQIEAIKQKITSSYVSDDLEFLHQFIEDVQHRYLVQINNDYESYSPGLTSVNELINAIRGVTEIESSQRDRNFQNTIAIFGVGLAVASFSVSVFGQFPGITDTQKAAKQLISIDSRISQLGIPESWLFPAVSVTISLTLGILAALMTWLIIKMLQWLHK